MNNFDDFSKKGGASFAELQASDAYEKAEGELPILIGENGGEALVADLSELPHLFVYSANSKELRTVLDATILSLLDKIPSSHLNFVMMDMIGLGLSEYADVQESFFWPNSIQQGGVVDDAKNALRILDSLVREIDERSELLRGSRSHNIKEYREVSQGQSGEYPPKPSIAVLVADYWRFINESKAAEISLGRIAELGKAVGIHLVAVTKEQPELMNADILSLFPSRIVFKTPTQEASQSLLFASDAANLREGETIFVKNKYFFGFKNTRKIMTEGSIDVEFANKVSSTVSMGLSVVSSVGVTSEDISRVCMKLQK